MFHLSRKIDYGLILLLELAQSRTEDRTAAPLSLKEIATRRYMSFFFLQRVAYLLKHHDLITATRGKTGGYLLAKPANHITLKTIFEALEGPMSIMYCLDMQPLAKCNLQRGCVPHRGLTLLNNDLKSSLNRITLSDFFEQPLCTH